MYYPTDYPLNLTIAEAQRIANLHEDDENWDFWKFMKQSSELLQTVFIEQITTCPQLHAQER